MSEWEREALAKCPQQPLFNLRFLDDIIGAWPYDITQFDEFISILNDHHPTIKVKYTLNSSQNNFLDTTIFLESINETQKCLRSKVYFKNTDTHPHTKQVITQNIPFQVLLNHN